MAHVQQLQIEIQKLKEALDISQKKSHRYSELVTTLYDELDGLRRNICYNCKNRLIVPGTTSGPGPASSPGFNASTAISSTSTPFWRRILQTRQRRLPSRPALDIAGAGHSEISSSTVPTIALITSETIPDATADKPTTDSGREPTPISPEPKSEPPEFSVEYNPEVKRVLNLYLEHVFTHESTARCVKMSPDGRRMAIGSSGTATIINETKTKSTVRVFVDRYVKDRVLIRSVKFSPDGRFLATGAGDHKIRIWDITQNRMRVVFKRHRNEVNSIAFSPDGRSLVSGSDDGSVRIWNIRDGSSKELPVTYDAGYFFSVVFSPDGRNIAAGNMEHSLWLWDSRTHKLVANWEGHSDSVWCVEFTPDGKGLISGSADKTVKYWDVSSLGIHEAISGKETVVPGHSLPLIRTFSGHTDVVYCIACFPSSNEWVITSSQDRSVRIWDIRTGDCQLVVQGHRAFVGGVDISGTENLLATVSGDCDVTLWRYEVL